MSNGQEAKDLRNFAGILRPGDSGALDEGCFGSLGRGQQSLSPGRGQAERGSGRRGGDLGEAWRRAQASCGFEWALQGTRRTTPRSRRRRRSAARKAPSLKPQKNAKKIDEAEDCKVALAFEKEQARRERERLKEEEAQRKQRERRQKDVDKAQSALDAARRSHDRDAAGIQAKIEELEEQSRAEEARWGKERSKLEAALRRTRG
jgi:hypothetical protein